MKHLLRLFTLALAAGILLLSVSCGGSVREILAYQSRALRLRVSYESGGIPIEAVLSLSAGNASRDMTLTILSPADAAGLTFVREGGHLSALLAGDTTPMGDLSLALAPLDFFTIPTSATLSDVTRDGDERLTTLLSGDTTWVLRFSSGEVPTQIDFLRGDTYRTLRILEILSSST